MITVCMWFGGGQPVLSCEQCFYLFRVFLPFLRLMLGAYVLIFACSSPVGGMLFGVSGLLINIIVMPGFEVHVVGLNIEYAIVIFGLRSP